MVSSSGPSIYQWYVTRLSLFLEIFLCMIYIIPCLWYQAVTAQSAIPPKPIQPTFSCPVCMGTLVEEMSTKCGHIFCKACIKASIAAQGKCPTCRRKITMKDTIRVYLPATSWDNKGWSSYPNKPGGGGLVLKSHLLSVVFFGTY